MTTTSGAQTAGITSYGVSSSAAFHADDPVILDVGDRLEVNRISAVPDGTHIRLAHATRFGHARDTQILHGGVGIGLTGNSRLIVFKNAMFEQCASGIMFDGVNFLDMEDILSSCTEVAQLVGPSSTGGSTSLWHASFKNVELARVPAADTMYVLRVRSSGDSNNVRQVEFDHIEKNPSSDGTLVEYQNDAGIPRNYTLCKSVAANRVCEQHYTSELPPSSDINSIYYNGMRQHAWQGNGNYTAVGTITAAAFAGNASTATALAADPAACLGTTVVKDIAANGTLTCSQPTLSTLADYGNPCNSAGQSVRRNSTNTANECFTPGTSAVGDVPLMSGIARSTGSDSHGVVLWGVTTSTDSGFDTGDKVCRVQGFGCVTTFDTPGIPIACGIAHTAYDGWLAECK